MKKDERKQKRTEFIVEAIGDAAEVIPEDEPGRTGLIKVLGQHGKTVARINVGGERPSYMSANILLAAGVEVGMKVRFTATLTAGAPQKIVDEDVAGALRKVKGRPTQKAVARELKVAESTIERWRARQGFKTWKEVVERHG
jgi:transcription initiation factor TFIIIB Brf1 subunit/transcription initiation factor TFIIB